MSLLSAGGYIIAFRCQVNCNYSDSYGTQTIMDTGIPIVIHHHGGCL